MEKGWARPCIEYRTLAVLTHCWQTGYYLASSALVEGHIVYNLFSQVDKDKHAAEKKPIAKYYAPNGVAPFEPHVDKTIKQFCHELETRFMTGSESGKPFDLGKWVLFCW